MPSVQKQIRAAGGTLHGHLFENAVTGLERAVYWAITVECRKVDWDLSDWQTSFSFEWLRWPVRDWRELDGKALGHVLRPPEPEASFYLADHHPARLDALQLSGAGHSAGFQLEASGVFDLPGFGEPQELDIPFRLATALRFEGIVVVPGNLAPKPATADEAAAALRPFMDLDGLGTPVWDQFRWVFPPRAA